MQTFVALVALGCVVSLGCGRDKNVVPVAASASLSGAATNLKAPSSAAPLPSPSASSRPQAASETHCLTAEEREQDFSISSKLRSRLAVVRVAPDDVLWLRQAPNARETTTGKLPHDARDVTPTGRVCRTGETTWYEVSLGSERGFANGSYLIPATDPRDETPRFAKLVVDLPLGNPEALIRAVVHGLKAERKEPSEVRFDVTQIGDARTGARAVVVLYACCYADDSVMGEQIWLDAIERDGRWVLERARVIKLCPRGATGSACV
jgi:hypothetical protein